MRKISILFLTLVVFTQSFAAQEPLKVKKILKNNYFFDSNNSRVFIKGIIVPERNNPTHGCHFLTVHKFLQEKIKGSTITKTTKDTFFLDGIDVRKILLAEGVATIDIKADFNTEFYELQESAFLTQKNIWKQPCLNRREKFLKQKKKEKFTQTVGFVESIIDGTHFRFKNGPIIKIENTDLPLFSDKSAAAQCFLKESKKFLEHTILHKWVQIKDNKAYQENNPQFKVFREVQFLNRTSFRENNIGNILIQKGYAKYQPKKINNEKLAQSQLNAYQQPLGAWSTCSPYVFGETTNHEKEEELNCFIKGNITGSKKNPIKKFHTQASPWYERTNAEACFESEKEAIEAGFVKVK